MLFLTGIALGVAGAAHRAAARPGVGMADLADPDDRLAVRRRVLSGLRSCPAGCGRSRALLPPSYVFEGMRAVVAGEPAPWALLAAGAGWRSSIWCSPACFFASVYRIAIRTGLIARYSAESVS